MLANQNPANKQQTFAALLEMGYEEDMINLALKESKSRSIEEVLDLLTFRETQYRTILKNKTIKPPLSEKKGNESKSMPNLEQNSRKNSAQDNKEDAKADPEGNHSLKEMDEKTAKGISFIIKAISNPHPKYQKDPNWLIAEISEHLKDLKFNNTVYAKEITKFLASSEYCPQISELRNKLFGAITKIMNMKLPKQHPLNIKEFENILLMSFELKVLTPKQMETVLTTYTKMCPKIGVNCDPELVNILDKYCMDASNSRNGFGPNLYKNDNTQLLDDPLLDNCPYVMDQKVSNKEEGKDKDEQSSSPEPTDNVTRPPHSVFDKETCIICMENMRECVFLPCSHFLTCPLCAPKVEKCPICNKHIKKTLKIFWG
jgi:hypothetical protein